MQIIRFRVLFDITYTSIRIGIGLSVNTPLVIRMDECLFIAMNETLFSRSAYLGTLTVQTQAHANNETNFCYRRHVFPAGKCIFVWNQIDLFTYLNKQ